MARRVFLHAGLPKSGTTYLQAVLAKNKSLLETNGLLYPGDRWSRQVDAVRDLRRMPAPPGRRAAVDGAWPRMVAEISAWPDDVLVSMEWLGSASTAQVNRVGRDLAGTEVHVIFTVRDLARTVPAAWQEFTQNRATWRWPDFLEQVAGPDPWATPAGRTFWAQQDLERLLARWRALVPPERLHVVTVPHRADDPDELWHRLAHVVGLKLRDVDTTDLRGNASLGLESAELMRRLNERLASRRIRLDDYNRLFKHRFSKAVLAARRSGESRLELPSDYHAWARDRAERQIAAVEAAGVDVVGDLAELRPGAPRPTDGATASLEPEPEAVLDAAVDALVTVLAGQQADAHGATDAAAQPGVGQDTPEPYLDQVERVLSLLDGECGVPAYLGTRTLRRVARGDDRVEQDIDIAYLSAFDNPTDVMVESLRIERVMRAHGFDVERNSGGHLGLKRHRSGGGRTLDVFSSYLADGRLHPTVGVDVEASRDDLLPLHRVDFHGRRLPVPADADRLLTPENQRSRAQRRRVRGWFGGMRETRDHWRRFYAASADQVPTEPSSFAYWVARHETPGRLLDLGCGTGRDTRFFADQGFDVVGVDAVVRHAHAAVRDLPAEKRPRLLRVNLDSLQETLITGAHLAHERGPRTVYARFLWHALSEGGRQNAWRLVAMALAGSGRGYLEFRTPQDAGAPKHFGSHYRRYLAPGLVVSEAERHGLRVVEWDTRRGWSRLGDEDPHLCRMILERKH